MDFTTIHTTNSPEEIAKMLCSVYSAEDAMITVILIKSQLPMYIGELNPKWKFWDEVGKEIYPESNEDKNQSFINEVFTLLTKKS